MRELELAERSPLPEPSPELIASIAIPAHDEAARIEATLAALADQRERDGSPLAPGSHETIVFANGCTDDTAERVRAFAARASVPFYVLEGELPEDGRHVGTARRTVMNLSAARVERSRNGGFVATTDADTIPAQTWIAETRIALSAADAVGGRIVLDPAELRGYDAPVRALISLEARYRFAVARLEAFRDPVPWDPWPRHAQCFGGSLAVRADAYRAAGGLPALPMLEDLALRAALDRNDARFRHSLRVRVRTSARRSSAVSGGLATYLGTLASHAAESRPFLVPHPSATLARIDGRAALRRITRRTATCTTPLDRAIVQHAYAVGERELRRRLRDTATLGALVQALEADADERRATPAPVALVDAAGALERYAHELGRYDALTNAPRLP